MSSEARSSTATLWRPGWDRPDHTITHRLWPSCTSRAPTEDFATFGPIATFRAILILCALDSRAAPSNHGAPSLTTASYGDERLTSPLSLLIFYAYDAALHAVRVGSVTISTRTELTVVSEDKCHDCMHGPRELFITHAPPCISQPPHDGVSLVRVPCATSENVDDVCWHASLMHTGRAKLHHT